MIAFKKRIPALIFLLILWLALNPGALNIAAPTLAAGAASPEQLLLRAPAHNPKSPLADGQLDPTFGSGGKVTSAFPGGFDVARAVTVQTDGKIVMAGNAESRFTVGRFLSNGALDPGFGVGGLTKTGFGGLSGQANAVAVQGDGKIVGAGSMVSEDITQTHRFALARYNQDGAPDPAFGSAGKVTTSFSGANRDEAFALAIQHDGKIVAAGVSQDTHEHFALARYNPDGSLDGTFGAGGFVITSIDLASQINSVAIQSNGKIVAAGWSSPVDGDESQNDFALARYNPDGSLDMSFGAGGKVTTDFGGGETAEAVVLLPGGRIVAGGSILRTQVGDRDYALARYNTNGTLDASFGAGGKVTTDFGHPNPTYDVGTTLVLRTDGKLVAAGYTYQYPNIDFAIARYNTNGTLDSSFGSGGKVITDFGTGDAQLNAAALQSDGKIVVGGYIDRLGGGLDFSLVRYSQGGALDATFGSGGVATADGGAGADVTNGVVVQRDGKIVVAGRSSGLGGGDFALARYNPDGTPDTSFGSGGEVTTDFGGGYDGAQAVVLLPSDKILVVGSHEMPAPPTSSYGGFALARYNSDGSLDVSFGSGGKVLTELGNGNGSGGANAVALRADGKIVVAGIKITGECIHFCTFYFVLARYGSDGTLDQSFGTGGIVSTSFPNSIDSWANTVVLQPDGKIVAAGSASILSGGSLGDFALARYNPDGSLDSSFGTGGLVTNDFANEPDEIQALAVQPDGKIVAAGSSGYTQCIPNFCVALNEFTLARYNPDGSLDASFGSGGKTTTAIPQTSGAQAMALQRDGKILTAGYFGYTGYFGYSGAPFAGFALARYTPAGALDPSFGVGSSGTVTTTVGTQGVAYALALQPDDKIVAAGQGTTEQGGLDFAVARYTNAPVSRCPGERFFDVCPDDYFYTATLALADDGILSGYNTSPPCPAGISQPCFMPYNSSTRGQISKVVSLAAGFNEPVTTQTFEDVPPSSTFYTYTERMAERGIISGYPCGAPNEPCVPPGNRPYFRTNRHVTRGQLSKMVSLAFDWNDPPAGQDFEDVTPGSTFYTYTGRLYTRSIINGYPCGGSGEPCVPPNNLPYFRPNGDVTRGQTAKIVQLARTQPSPTPTITLTPVPAATSTVTSTATAPASSTPPVATTTPILTSTATTTPAAKITSNDH